MLGHLIAVSQPGAALSLHPLGARSFDRSIAAWCFLERASARCSVFRSQYRSLLRSWECIRSVLGHSIAVSQPGAFLCCIRSVLGRSIAVSQSGASDLASGRFGLGAWSLITASQPRVLRGLHPLGARSSDRSIAAAMESLQRMVQHVVERLGLDSRQGADEVMRYCAAEELDSVEDLAVLLPVDASQEDGQRILGPGACKEAVTLLVEVSTLARQGLSTWSYLQVRKHEKSQSSGGASSAAPPARRSAPSGQEPSQSAVAKVRARLERALVSPSLCRPRAELHVEALSLRAAVKVSDDKVLQRCFALLHALADKCPRYSKLFGVDSPSDAMLQVQSDVFKAGLRNMRTVDVFRREVENLISMGQSLGWAPNSMTEWQVAAYLRDQHNRGKTVPGRVYRALAWGENALEICWHTGSALVKSQRYAQHDALHSGLQFPKPAKCVTVEILTGMEVLTFSALSLPLRAWAGFHAFLGHGVLRFSDAQRCTGLRLTKDALVAQPWAMKNQPTPHPVAALRMGWSGREWAAEWLSVLSAANLPGSDFVMLAMSVDCAEFTNRIAGFQDAQMALRTLLQLPPIGLQAMESLTYSEHSFRHLYVTAGRQLDLRSEHLNEMGHWALNSTMPRVYDSMACTSELAAKAVVSKAISGGWTPVGPGLIPVLPESMSSAAPALVEPTSLEAKKKRVKCKPALEECGPAVVVHWESLKVHVPAGDGATVCNKWKCGTTAAPARNAKFFASLISIDMKKMGYSWCRPCELKLPLFAGSCGLASLQNEDVELEAVA